MAEQIKVIEVVFERQTPIQVIMKETPTQIRIRIWQESQKQAQVSK